MIKINVKKRDDAMDADDDEAPFEESDFGAESDEVECQGSVQQSLSHIDMHFGVEICRNCRIPRTIVKFYLSLHINSQFFRCSNWVSTGELQCSAFEPQFAFPFEIKNKTVEHSQEL